MNKSFRLSLLLALCVAGLLQACIPLVAVGVGGGVAATIDRRTYGEQVMDTEIQHRFNRQFPSALEAKTNASATVFNRWVLLTGQAMDEQSRAEVEALARSIPNVREVFNELSIAYPASFTSRSGDTLLTSKVKARLFDSPLVAGTQVKVSSESGIVYLMGLLTEAEANAAVDIARTTAGARKVVNMIEIITPEQAQARTVAQPPAAEQSAE
ncbi:MAG: transporter [Candidatus Dactylopiibacterium carminicum]|uniref:BON domain-containing protein n=1 Tax=Candidatus Dactylopiibacterium carminicum TaxID=857335 RepID=A0A272EX51_9RHOO|nr:BON domain-containing protein [Candidatus Dactylopiibacterium carminicum]KAF7600268.1 BON domain-containing protein [Candidatus Dactylopiibacterium carminicum]PAS94679.1 MAG: transporter [Candidatus Dactylopiibacterium carminicum]PAS96967.1 MAG: transporter [Candidatus Dactylopiibacterium carminicum]PAT00267.1 MAG: hypothetical protein BSR46_03355 [Candidatus Dactylopiibacterium carminicum]